MRNIEDSYFEDKYGKKIVNEGYFYNLYVDVDNKELLDMWEEDYFKTRKAILKSLGIKLIKIIKHISLSCPKCKLSWQVLEGTEKKCLRCRRKKGITFGRGYHLIYQVRTNKKLKDEDFLKIQFLLGDDPGRVYLGYLKLKEGIKLFNVMFSKILYRKPRNKRCLNCRLRSNLLNIMGKDNY